MTENTTEQAVENKVAPEAEAAAPAAPQEVKQAEIKEEPITILGKQDEETPAQVTNKEETPAGQEEGSQSEEPAPLPTYEAFVRPDGEKVDNAEIIKTLGQFEADTKADHAQVQKLGQSLIDLHHTALTKALEDVEKSRTDALESQKSDWKEAFVADPEIGGNRQNTTVSAALEFIRTHGGTKEQQKEFHDVLESTGLGNHPAMIRILANASRALQEGKPLPATRPMQAVSKIVKRYGTK